MVNLLFTESIGLVRDRDEYRLSYLQTLQIVLYGTFTPRGILSLFLSSSTWILSC